MNHMLSYNTLEASKPSKSCGSQKLKKVIILGKELILCSIWEVGRFDEF